MSEEFFFLDKFDNAVPEHRFRVVHVVDPDNVLTFQHQALPVLIQDTYVSHQLGRCDDASLLPILEAYEDVPVPSDVEGENCQNWIRRALEEVVEMGSTLSQGYETILDDIKDMEMDM